LNSREGLKMTGENHLKEAKGLYEKAKGEFEKARGNTDAAILRDACGKGWLSAIETAYALLVKNGVREEELPKTDRGRSYVVNKHAERELRLYYSSLRDNLHIEGYYDGLLSFDEVERQLDDLKLYIQKVEELESK